LRRRRSTPKDTALEILVMEFGAVDPLEAPNSDVDLGSEEHAEESREKTFKKEQGDLEKAFGFLSWCVRCRFSRLPHSGAMLRLVLLERR
jgi:hypothetical protein